MSRRTSATPCLPHGRIFFGRPFGANWAFSRSRSVLGQLPIAQMSDAFSIVDANGTPIQYGSSQKPRRRSSPPNDALSVCVPTIIKRVCVLEGVC